MFRPSGYSVGSCYIGMLPGKRRMSFPTEQEYLDYVRSLDEEGSAA